MKKMPNSKRFLPTYILIGLNIGFYLYTSLIGGNFVNTSSDMIIKFGQVNILVLYGGQYYQLLTSLFVHGNIAHLFGNMLFLFIFGLRAEEVFSLPEYLAIFLINE